MLLHNRLAAVLMLMTGTVGAAQLTVKYGDRTLDPVVLEDGVRLDQFYAKTPFPADVNWQNALITNPAMTSRVAAQGQTLQDHLYRLQLWWRDRGDGDYAIAAWYVAQALKQVPVAGRIPTALDPDRVRLSLQSNRPLVGDYQLYLAPYSKQLFLFGLIRTDIDIGTAQVFKDLPLRSGWSVENYLQGRRFLPGGDKNMGYLISGTGTWRKVPLAMWNRQHIEPAAGETLFIGFDPAILPEEMSSLNEQIADYLANRIPH